MLYNSLSGVGKYLRTNVTSVEVTDATTLVSFDSSGFTVGAGDNGNNSGTTAVAWQWNAGGSTVTNTDGTISAQVRANPTAGFSVVTWSGNSSSSATVGHGLGVTPAMIVIKNRTSGSTYWSTYHKSLSSGYNVNLNETSTPFQPASGSSQGGAGTSPTSTVFGFIQGTSNLNNVNAASNDYVAYCFSEVAGYSKFGSYTGNASTDGTFVYTGFRPKYVLVKNTTNAVEWEVYDSTRNPSNGVNLGLIPNQSDAEGTYSPPRFDFLSNGFKLRTAGGGVNGSGNTIIYAAFAEVPTKFALAR
jgi:hypothetical protein